MTKSEFRPYNPEEDGRKELYEIRPVEIGKETMSVFVPVNTSRVLASKTPWYYAVKKE